MTLLRIAIAGLGIALALMCVWAGMNGHFLNEFGVVGGLAWGKVSLADLYIGFGLLAVPIALTEKVKLSVPIIIALFLLGNIVGALWLAWRLPELVMRLKQDKLA